MNNSALIVLFIQSIIGVLILNPMMKYAWAEDRIADAEALALPMEMSDHELAEMHGRYVDVGQVVYFTLQMTTQWTDGIGQVVGSGLSLGVPVNNSSEKDDHPPARLQTLTKKKLADRSKLSRKRPSRGNKKVVSGVALNDVNGLAQSVQVAGDGNTVKNAVRMEVLKRFAGQAENVAPSDAEPPVKDGWAVLESVDSIGSKSITTESGAVLGTQLEPRKVGVSVDIPGIGRAVQQIRGGNVEELNGLLQSVQLAADRQQVQNLLDLQAVFQQSNQFDAQRHLTPALQSLIGIQTQR